MLKRIRIPAVFHRALTAVLLLIGNLGEAAAKGPNGSRLAAIDPSAVKVGGEIGRRIEVTIKNNLLALDVEKDFLRPFREKKGVANSAHHDRYVGLGKLIDATVHFSCSRNEQWHINQDGTGNVGESCATAYLIRLLHTMLCIDGTSNHGDVLERAIYNALFAAQLPEGRRLRYFTPLEGQRPIFGPDTYCCPNNFRRIMAELPTMIYYRLADGGLTINLYTASSAAVRFDNDLKLDVRQETDYPNSGKVVVHLTPSRPARFPVRLRIPAWCRNAKVAVTAEPVGRSIPGGAFYKIERTWKAGDTISLDLPMTWRLIRGRKLQQGRVAVMRGPLLFCLNPSRVANVTNMESSAAVPLATLRARLRKVSAALALLQGDPVDLADIAAGGNGFGSAEPLHGIDPRNGKHVSGNADYLAVEANRFVRCESPYVDGVLLPDGEDGRKAVKITSTGIVVAGLPDTCARTWDYFKNGPVLYQGSCTVGEIDFSGADHSMLSIHSNKVIPGCGRHGSCRRVVMPRRRIPTRRAYHRVTKPGTVAYRVCRSRWHGSALSCVRGGRGEGRRTNPTTIGRVNATRPAQDGLKESPWRETGNASAD